MKGFVLGIAAALLAAAPGSAFAAGSCALSQLASFDVSTLPSGDITIPVKIAGTDQQMLLDLTVANSAVLGSFADQLKLPSKPLPMIFGGHIGYFHQRVTDQALLPDIQFGSAHGTNVWVLKLPEKLHDDVTGVIGSGMLSNMDLELDLAHAKVNLFSSDHCKGNVVYWGTPYTALPFERDPVGHIIFHMNLDGRAVTTSFKMEPGPAEVDLSVVAHMFGLDEHAPGMKVVEPVSGETGGFKYPFKSLALEGVTIANPDILITPDDPVHRCNSKVHNVDGRPVQCFSGGDLMIGLHELRAMHLYFAMKEKMLYVTAAETHAAEPRRITP